MQLLQYILEFYSPLYRAEQNVWSVLLSLFQSENSIAQLTKTQNQIQKIPRHIAYAFHEQSTLEDVAKLIQYACETSVSQITFYQQQGNITNQIQKLAEVVEGLQTQQTPKGMIRPSIVQTTVFLQCDDSSLSNDLLNVSSSLPCDDLENQRNLDLPNCLKVCNGSTFPVVQKIVDECNTEIKQQLKQDHIVLVTLLNGHDDRQRMVKCAQQAAEEKNQSHYRTSSTNSLFHSSHSSCSPFCFCRHPFLSRLLASFPIDLSEPQLLLLLRPSCHCWFRSLLCQCSSIFPSLHSLPPWLLRSTEIQTLEKITYQTWTKQLRKFANKQQREGK